MTEEELKLKQAELEIKSKELEIKEREQKIKKNSNSNKILRTIVFLFLISNIIALGVFLIIYFNS